ncbi:MAG: hypothetical protein R3B98_08635 [Hyphomonas sp.]
MGSDRHMLFGGALVAVVIAACIAGLVVGGGPGTARKQKEDNLRLQALSKTAIALACYQQAMGDVPEDFAQVEEAFSHATSGVREPIMCRMASVERDPITGEYFRLKRTDGKVTHICADFATGSEGDPYSLYANMVLVAPDLSGPREGPGEQCFEVRLNADLK